MTFMNSMAGLESGHLVYCLLYCTHYNLRRMSSQAVTQAPAMAILEALPLLAAR